MKPLYLFAAILLSACTSSPKVEMLTIPEYLIADCELPQPPSPTKYAIMNFLDKEKTLVNRYLRASELNNACNIRLQAARAYQARVQHELKTNGKVTNDSRTLSSQNPTGLPASQR